MGSIDFKEVRKAIDDISYSGWIHMEATQMPLGIEGSCRYNLEYLRGIFPPRGAGSSSSAHAHGSDLSFCGVLHV